MGRVIFKIGKEKKWEVEGGECMDRNEFDLVNMDGTEIDPDYGGRAQSKRLVKAQKVFAPRAIIPIPKSTIDRIW